LRYSVNIADIVNFSTPGGGAFEVERQEARQRLPFADVGRPAISGGDRRVEVAVRVVEPGRPLVIEIGQRAGLEVGN
jgi:hypothetical protein